MSDTDYEKCPVCLLSEVKRIPSDKMHNCTDYDCPNCRKFRLDRRLHTHIEELSESQRAVLAHHLYMRRDEPDYILTEDRIGAAKDLTLPSPARRRDLAILYIGDQQAGVLSRTLRSDLRKLRAAFGVHEMEDINVIVRETAKDGITDGSFSQGIRLTLKGWEEYDRIRREKIKTRRAFMAMPFNIPEFDRAYNEAFRPGAADAGYDLRRIDEEAPAGSITNRMRVEIRESRFLVAELTNRNPGAYWEAGFAEGLERPVIYTFRPEPGKEQQTHFDTRDFNTVYWRQEDLEDARRRLADTIRATFPFEATMEN